MNYEAQIRKLLANSYDNPRDIAFQRGYREALLQLIDWARKEREASEQWSGDDMWPEVRARYQYRTRQSRQGKKTHEISTDGIKWVPYSPYEPPTKN